MQGVDLSLMLLFFLMHLFKSFCLPNSFLTCLTVSFTSLFSLFSSSCMHLRCLGTNEAISCFWWLSAHAAHLVWSRTLRHFEYLAAKILSYVKRNTVVFRSTTPTLWSPCRGKYTICFQFCSGMFLKCNKTLT